VENVKVHEMANTTDTPAMKVAMAKVEERAASKGGYMSLSKALQLVKAGATASDLVSSPLPVRRPAKDTSENDRCHDMFANVMEIPLLFKGTYCTELTWKVQGRPSEETIRQMFVGKRCFTPVEGIQRDPLDPHFKQGGGKENICTVVHATRLMKQNGDAYMRIAQGDEEHYTPAEMQQAREWCAEARNFVVTNGPMISCFQRLVHAVSTTTKPLGRLYIEPETVEAVCAMLPWKATNVREMQGRMPGEFEWLVLNLNSSSGFPWDKPKKEVLKEAYEATAQLINAVRDGTVQQLLAKHPQWLLVKLMNKLDRYDARDILKAPEKGVIRQYFVYPFHWVMLFSAVNQNVSQAMVGFWEDPASFSAHGFAWQEGGPQRIIDWIRASVAKGPGIYGIAYSDDQLWVVVTKDGKVYILAPDINRMDLNLVNLVGRLYYEYGSRVLQGKVDKTWDAILRLQCKMAFTCPVILEYGMVMQTENFLHSGVPGTPEFDQVASAAAFHTMKKVVGQPENLADAKQRLQTGFGVWMQKYGLTVKPYELHLATAELADPTTEEFITPWSFLGKHLMFEPRVAGWLPRSDPVRCIASILAPKSTQFGNAGIRAQMQRVRQIVAAGGFSIPQVWRSMQSWYQTCRVSLKLTPADPFEPADQELIEPAVDLELAVSLQGPEFPSFIECCNLYMPPHRRVDLRTMVPTIAGVAREQKGVISAATLVSSLFDESTLFETTGKWADSSEAPASVSGDAGASNIAPLPTTSAERMGRARPKTAEEQKAADEARRIRFLNRMERIRSGAWNVLKGKPGTAKKGRALLGEKGRAFVAAFVDEQADNVDEELAPVPPMEAYVGVEEELASFNDEAMADDYYADLEYEAEQTAGRRRKALTSAFE